MQQTLTLRPWQRRALTQLASHPHRDFLAVATPGAGKTTFALVALNQELHGRVGPAIIVAPTAHLKVQWATNAAKIGLHVDPFWETGTPFAPDMHGIVTTYQQVALSADYLQKACWDGIVILDEVHHAGDEMAWGDAVAKAFSHARRRISLSGTPFRSDTAAIPFVSYHMEEAEADFEYGYADALADGVVRPVYFPHIDGEMEWISPDGSHYGATFTDHLTKTLTSQRLRTALAAEGSWLPDVLARANSTLTQIRAKSQANAGGLVICIDTDHARAVARLLEQVTGKKPVVAVSDDPKASQNIAAFEHSTEPWIVAVRMVSEGVDIPRLRVGVYATTITTELFFRQAVGRLVRVTPDTKGARSVMFIPNDPRLKTAATLIEEPRYHVLRKKEDPDEDGFTNPNDMFDTPSTLAGEPEQLSLFEAIRAETKDNQDGQDPEWLLMDDSYVAHGVSSDGDQMSLTLAPPPTISGKIVPAGGLNNGLPGKTRAETKTSLRKRNADLVRVLVQRTNQTPLQINASLNRQVGVEKVSLASLDQLKHRAELAMRWLDKTTL